MGQQEALNELRGVLNNNYTLNRITKDFLFGETIHSGQAVYINTDGKIYKVDPSISFHTDRYIGVLEKYGSNSSIGRVVLSGLSTTTPTYINGSIYYIASDSYLTTTTPISGNIIKVGIGTSQGIIIVSSSANSDVKNSNSYFPSGW